MRYTIFKMNAEIISIGTEILLGHIINSNTAFMAQRLAKIGIDNYFHVTVGDNPTRLANTIKTALDRSDCVLTCGGLGPTIDDITTQMIAEVTKRRLVLEKSIIKEIIIPYFNELNRKIPKDSLRQALIPEGCKWLKNPFGTAPGLICEQDNKILIALPGPPREMKPMVDKYVVPYLKSKVKGGEVIASRSLKLIGIPEANVNEKVKDLLKLSGKVTVGIYANIDEVKLKIMSKAESEKSAEKEIKKIEKTIRSRFKDYIYGIDDETLQGIVAGLLQKKKKTIAVAESCTGGLLSTMLTDISGSSKYLLEGIITYSDKSKVKHLDVPADLIKKHGAVSLQVAKKMAYGIRNRSDTDIGVGITGIAGPTGATKKKPIGLVYISISTKKKEIVKRFNFGGQRHEIRSQAARAALDMLRREL